MNLKKYILPECVLANVDVDNKEDLFRLQARAIYDNTPERYREHLSFDDLMDALVHREEKQSTGLGDGIAIPHARIEGFKHIGFSLAILKNPLPFDALDGEPVVISCMVVAAAENPGIIIKIWALLAHLLQDPAVHAYFLQSKDNSVICDYLLNQVESLETDVSLTACDIMFRPLYTAHPETPLPDVTYNMYRTKEPAIAVVDATNKLVGEITADALFQYGMPEFFTQLQSVSFVRNFNPLEKYFTDEGKLCAQDVIQTDYAAVPQSATLIEVIFQLSVKKRTKVYVVDDDGNLVGVIGRLSVIDRAINF